MKRNGKTFNVQRSTLNVHCCVAAGLALAVISAGCGRGKSDSAAPAPKPVPLVQVAQAQKRDLTRTLTFTGSVEPIKVARMASPAEGPIVACSVREGDPVKKGQILVKVGRSRIAETGLEAAREELRRQEAESKRVEQLVKRRFRVPGGILSGKSAWFARSASC